MSLFKCLECEFTFEDWWVLADHLAIYHNVEEEKGVTWADE